MSERQDAIRLANKILEDPGRDPDGDLSMLARQFLRTGEALLRVGFHAGDCTFDFWSCSCGWDQMEADWRAHVRAQREALARHNFGLMAR